MEEWRPIPGHKGYEASRGGQIRNAKTGRIIKQYASPSWSGTYYKVDLTREKKHLYVHRLVAAAYHGAAGQNTDHRDGDRGNNSPENLEPMSQSGNLAKRERLFGYGDAWEPSGEVNLNFPTEA